MKNRIYVIIYAIFALIFMSCDNDFDYENDVLIPLLKEKYNNLPQIIIETTRPLDSINKIEKFSGCLQIWENGSPLSDAFDLTIHGRGNNTWSYPKKPYAVKLIEKHSLFGMPPAKKWIMLANARDRTLLRNALAFEISRRIGLEWTPNGAFAEVFLNEEFLGNYFITEKIQVSKNRLNLSEDATIITLDDKYDSPQKFRTKYFNFPVNIEDPKEISDAKFKQINLFLDSAECVLLEKCSGDIETLIDFESFAKYWIIHEIAENGESIHPKSVYMYKEPGSPLKAGPVWDFDNLTFKGYSAGFLISNNLWYKELTQNPSFIAIAKNIWNERKSALDNLDSYVDSLVNYIRKSNNVNIAMWPIKKEIDHIGDEDLPLDEAITMMKNSYKLRIHIIDSLFSAF